MTAAMWQAPAPGSGREVIDDLLAQLAASNNKLRELSKEVVYLNGLVWEMHKKLDKGNGP